MLYQCNWYQYKHYLIPIDIFKYNIRYKTAAARESMLQFKVPIFTHSPQ